MRIIGHAHWAGNMAVPVAPSFRTTTMGMCELAYANMQKDSCVFNCPMKLHDQRFKKNVIAGLMCLSRSMLSSPWLVVVMQLQRTR